MSISNTTQSNEVRREPTVQELKTRIATLTRRSNSRKRALRSLAKAHELSVRNVKRLSSELVDQRKYYANLYNDYLNISAQLQKATVSKSGFLDRIFGGAIVPGWTI